MMNFLFGHCNDPRHLVLTFGELACGVGTMLAWALVIAVIAIIIAGISYGVARLN